MKPMLLFLAAALIAGMNVIADVKPGQRAPDFTGVDINGKVFRMSDFQGRIVVLEAFNPDCPFTANHYKSGAMQALQTATVGKGVVWLLVNSTPTTSPSYRKPADARKEFTASGIKATAWLDDHSGAIGKLFGMKTTPHLFVIDTAGVVAYQGAIDDRATNSGDPRTARNYVRQAIEALLVGKPVPLAETKSYGSNVKYAEP